jgi:hypothetical protein
MKMVTDIFEINTNFTIISGGQSGADRAGLDWAIAHGIAHGGWCPKGRRCEDGPLASHYQLKETPLSNYLQRTEWNVRDSDATLIFTSSEKLDGGSKRTADFAEKLGKPFLHMRPGVHPKYIARFLARNSVARLNIAGKSASSAPDIMKFVNETLTDVFLVSTMVNLQN